jgi:ABC-type oligopeptide transport system substrate-binding subunit
LLQAVPAAALATTAIGTGIGPAAAQDTELAEDQTLRLISWGLPAYIRPQNEGGPLRMMTENTFMPPFYEDETGALINGICSEYTASEDGLHYTLKINPDAKFSDGSPVTAADLKFSWEYLCWPETKTWSSSYVAGPIEGYADVFAGTTKELTGLVATDDQTLDITLTKPFTPFLQSIATYIAVVVKKDQVVNGDDTWDTAPINCGPYKVESYDKTTGDLNWVPNEHWWGTAPIIQKINYRYIQDPNTASIMYDNDECDVIMCSDILSAQLRSGPHKDDLKLIPYGGVVFYSFDTTRAPMEDKNVRTALLKATDMGTIVKAVFGENQSPAYGLISPNLKDYTNPSPYYDPEGAKAALAASTYGSADKLPKISIRVPTNNTEYVRVSEALQQMWKDTLGVETEVSLFAQGEEREDGVSQVFRVSLGTLYTDTSASVSALGLSTGSYMIQNVKAVNPELDEILTKADTMPREQEAERGELYKQAEAILMDEAYFIPIIWVQYYYAVKPWVNNLKSNTSLSFYTLPEMSIAKH